MLLWIENQLILQYTLTASTLCPVVGVGYLFLVPTSGFFQQLFSDGWAGGWDLSWADAIRTCEKNADDVVLISMAIVCAAAAAATNNCSIFMTDEEFHVDTKLDNICYTYWQRNVLEISLLSPTSTIAAQMEAVLSAKVGTNGSKKHTFPVMLHNFQLKHTIYSFQYKATIAGRIGSLVWWYRVSFKCLPLSPWIRSWGTEMMAGLLISRIEMEQCAQ